MLTEALVAVLNPVDSDVNVVAGVVICACLMEFMNKSMLISDASPDVELVAAVKADVKGLLGMVIPAVVNAVVTIAVALAILAEVNLFAIAG